MADENDLFAQLPQGSYDDVVFAVVGCNISTGSAAAFHKFPFRPGQKIELTGREPVSGSVRCAAFRNLFAEKEGGRNVLWPGTVQRLREKAQTQKTAALVIPPYGTLPKAFIRLDEEYTATTRSGCFFTLTFAEDSTDLIQIGEAKVSAVASLGNAAARADLELAASKIANQYRMEDSAGGSVTDFVTAVAAFQYSIETAGTNLAKPIRQATQIVGAAQDLLRTSKGLLDPTSWQARDALLDLVDAVQRAVAESRITRAGRAVKSMVVAAATSLPALAIAVGNTVEELLALNSMPDAYALDAGDELLFYAA